VVVADRVGDLEVLARVERDALVAASQLDRPGDAQEPAGHAKVADAGFVDEIHERRRAPVHDRHLGVVQLHHRIVDPETRQGRQQVFDRLHRPLVLGQTGGVLNAGQVPDGGLDFEAAEVGATEADAGVGRAGRSVSVTLLPE